METQFLLVCIFCLALAALILAAVAEAKVTKKVGGPRNSLRANQQQLWGYSETWTEGSGTYNDAQNVPEAPYNQLDVLILAFCDLTFDTTGPNILINGLNNNTPALLADRRRLNYEGANLLDATSFSDPYPDATTLQSEIQSVQAQGTKVYVSMGGANGSNANQFLALQPAQIVQATEFENIDGWDWDIECPVDPNAFFQMMTAIRSALKQSTKPDTKMNLCIEATQTQANKQGQYATVFQQAPNTLFDSVSIQFYNEGYPWDVRVDVQALLGFGFNPSQIFIGINPGVDEIADAPYATQVSDATTIAGYVQSQGLGGMFIWSIQRDTPNPSWSEPDNSSSITTPNTWFPFGTSAPVPPPNGWNPPWPAANNNIGPFTYTPGQFATELLNVLH